MLDASHQAGVTSQAHKLAEIAHFFLSRPYTSALSGTPRSFPVTPGVSHQGLVRVAQVHSQSDSLSWRSASVSAETQQKVLSPFSCARSLHYVFRTFPRCRNLVAAVVRTFHAHSSASDGQCGLALAFLPYASSLFPADHVGRREARRPRPLVQSASN